MATNPLRRGQRDGELGVPCFPDQVLDVAARELLVRRASRPLSVFGDKDIFIAIGYCGAWPQIMDFRRTAAAKSVRYAARIAPDWWRGGTESNLRTAQATVDAALTGDPWAANWAVCCAGGVARQMCGLGPPSGKVGADDPIG